MPSVKKISVLTIASLIVALSAYYIAMAAWSEPTSAPPGGNIPIPLNTGNLGQSKIGGLILNTGGSTNGLIIDQGNVGIGATAPSTLLDVYSSSTITPQIRQTGSTYVGMRMDTVSANAGARNWAVVADNLAYGDFGIMQSNALGGDPVSAGTHRLYIKADGNVGIGTTAPGAKLDVAGETRIGAATADGLLQIRGDAGGYAGRFLNLGRTTNPSGFFAMQADYYGISIDALSNNVVIQTKSTGKVGIGTTAPGYRLAVRASQDNSANNVVTGSILSVGETTNGLYFRERGGTAGISGMAYAQQLMFNNGTGEIYTIGANHLILGTNTTEHVRITSAGNVGIGTTNPTADKLVINGGIDLSGPSAETFITRYPLSTPFGPLTIRFKNGPNINTPGIKFQTANAAGAYTDRLVINTDTDSPYLLLNPNGGNVGIGTTGPISTAGINRFIHLSGTSAGIVLQDSDETNKNWDIYNAGGDLYFYDDTSDRVIIKNGGNVGIGTTAPGTDLAVRGTNYGVSIIQASGDTVWNTMYLSNNGANRIIGSNIKTKTGSWVVPDTAYASSFIDFSGTAGSSYLGDISFSTRAAGDVTIGTAKMTILNNGNVGIGVTNPGEKLEVNGNIKFTASGAAIKSGNIPALTTSFQDLSTTATIGGLYVLSWWNTSNGAQGVAIVTNRYNSFMVVSNDDGSGAGVTFNSNGYTLQAKTTSGTVNFSWVML